MIEKVEYKGKVYDVIDPGSLKWEGDNLYDQLDPNLSEFNRKIIGHYIRKKYGLLQREYYSIVVLRGDESKLPKCPVCGKVPNFAGLTRRCYRETCSLSHGQIWKIMRGVHEFGSTHEERSAKSSKIARGRIESGVHQFFDPITRINNHKATFMNKGDLTDTCRFYIARLSHHEGWIKIGATSYDVSYRSYMQSISSDEYIEVNVLVTSDRKTIAELEALVKTEFLGRSVQGLEYFDESMESDIVNFVQSINL